MQNISIGEAKIAVHVTGSGRPLLLAHGFPLDHTMWSKQIEHFSTTHLVIAPDLRGFGKSQSPTAHIISMQRLADDCAEVVKQLDIIEPIVFCGLSMGGYVAWEFVRRHRELLGRLILCDTRAIADDPETARARKVMAEHVTSQGLTALCESMLPKLLGSNASAELKQSLKQTILDNDPAHVAAIMRGLAGRDDATVLLPKIDVPTLVLCGEEDVISPADEMRAFAEKIPIAAFVSIPGAGHMAPMENATETNAAIERFLQGGIQPAGR